SRSPRPAARPPRLRRRAAGPPGGFPVLGTGGFDPPAFRSQGQRTPSGVRRLQPASLLAPNVLDGRLVGVDCRRFRAIPGRSRRDRRLPGSVCVLAATPAASEVLVTVPGQRHRGSSDLAIAPASPIF